ncbi:HlyC/CorC family transporter [Rickettsiales bacterium]|nr:HlyC/CorC family transporter [Rickettsiales bacterium]
MDSEILIPLISIFFLLLTSAFFSGSETGLTAVSKGRIFRLMSKGNKRAKMVAGLREDKDVLISTILLGNNAVNIFASALATSLAMTLYGDKGIFIATILMTFVVLVFAEVIPKTYAFYHAEKTSLFVAPILRMLVILFSPITKIIKYSTDLVLAFSNVNKKSEGGAFTEEIRGEIELQHHEGKIVKSYRDMLGSILDLSETEVSDVMIHRKNVNMINIDNPVSQVIAEALDGVHTRIPLWSENTDNVVGILHIKTLINELRNYKGDINNFDLSSVMSEPWFVPETNFLDNQLSQFKKKHSHLALVVDEYGEFVGIITLEDILEEIVGQIRDEHDQEIEGIKKLANGDVEINGETSIRDINRELDWSLPDDDANTIAGLVIHYAETIPNVGQSFEFCSIKATILKKKRHQITKILVSKNSNTQTPLDL